jgi:G-protein signaling modulator 2
MIADLQSERMDEQRCSLLPGLKGSNLSNLVTSESAATKPEPDEPFFDMLMRCQGSRIEEQRSELPKSNIVMDAENGDPAGNTRRSPGGRNTNTLPDEDFFSLIMRVQGGRMEDQRATVSFFLI